MANLAAGQTSVANPMPNPLVRLSTLAQRSPSTIEGHGAERRGSAAVKRSSLQV